MNNIVKRRLIKVMLKSQKVDLICIQETKWKNPSDYLARSLFFNGFMEWKANCAKGASVGILLFCDKRVLQLEDA